MEGQRRRLLIERRISLEFHGWSCFLPTKFVSQLTYADDIAIITVCNNHIEASQHLESFIHLEVAKKWRIKTNETK